LRLIDGTCLAHFLMSLLLGLVVVQLACLNVILSRVWHLVDVLSKLRGVETLPGLAISSEDPLLAFDTHSRVCVLGALDMGRHWSVESSGLFT